MKILTQEQRKILIKKSRIIGFTNTTNMIFEYFKQNNDINIEDLNININIEKIKVDNER